MVRCAVCASPSAAVFCSQTCHGLCMSCAERCSKCAVCREPLQHSARKPHYFSRYATLLAKENNVRLRCSNEGCKEKFSGEDAFENLTRHSLECKAIKCYGALLDCFDAAPHEEVVAKHHHGCDFKGDFNTVDEHMATCPKALFVLAERLDRRVKELEAERVEQTKRIDELEDALEDARWEEEERNQQFGGGDGIDVSFGEESGEEEDEDEDEDYTPNGQATWPGAA